MGPDGGRIGLQKGGDRMNIEITMTAGDVVDAHRTHPLCNAVVKAVKRVVDALAADAGWRGYMVRANEQGIRIWDDSKFPEWLRFEITAATPPDVAEFILGERTRRSDEPHSRLPGMFEIPVPEDVERRLFTGRGVKRRLFTPGV